MCNHDEAIYTTQLMAFESKDSTTSSLSAPRAVRRVCTALSVSYFTPIPARAPMVNFSISTLPGANAYEQSSDLQEPAPRLSLDPVLSESAEARIQELYAWMNRTNQRGKTTGAISDVREVERPTAMAELKTPTEGPPVTEDYLEREAQDLTLSTAASETTITSLGQPDSIVRANGETESHLADATKVDTSITSPSGFAPPRTDVADTQTSTVIRHSKFTIQWKEDAQVPIYRMQQPDQIPNAPKDRNDNHTFSYLLFRGPNKEEVSLHYVWQLRGAEAKARLFAKCKAVGFDTEFSVGCNGKVQLIQIASETDIVLFHVALLEKENPAKALPKSLRKIMESPNIIKTASSVHVDADKVKKAFGCQVRGCVDLKKFLHAVHENEKGEKADLSTMTRRYFGLGLDKDQSNRSGDWSKLLSPKQIEYGASDAYASLKVYQMIDAERQARRLPSAQHLINAHITPWTIAKGQKRKSIEYGNPTLYDELHQLRLRLGTEVGVDGCRIMTNAIMRDIVRVMPTTIEELQTIAPTKLCDFHVYGDNIVKVVLAFVKKNAVDLERHKRLRLMRSESMPSSQDSGYGSCSQKSFFDDAMYGMAGAEDLRDQSITGVDELEEVDEFGEKAMSYVDLTTFDDGEMLAEVQEMEQTPSATPKPGVIPPVNILAPQETTVPQPIYHQMSLLPEENASINWYRATRIGGAPLSSEEPHVRKNKATKSFDMESYKKFLKNVRKEKETNKNSSLNKNTAFMRHLNEHPW